MQAIVPTAANAKWRTVAIVSRAVIVIPANQRDVRCTAGFEVIREIDMKFFDL